MSRSSRLISLAQAIGADIKGINAKLLAATKVFDPWHTIGAAGEPAFSNGAAATVGYTVRFRKDVLGKVSFSGAISLAAGAGDHIVFTLPVGYRPVGNDRSFSCPSTGGTTVAVWVNVDGAVHAPKGSSYAYLDSIEFDTESLTEIGVMLTGASQVAVPIDAWHTVGAAGEPTFNANWTAPVPISFRKDPLGRVWLRGLGRATAGGFAFNAAAARIFTLPEGYRPAQDSNIAVRVVEPNGTTASMCLLQVTTGGAVVVAAIITGAPTGAQNTYCDLDAVNFDTATVTTMLAGPQGPKGDTGGVSVVTTTDWDTALVSNFYRSRYDLTGLLPKTTHGPGDALNPPAQAGIVTAHENGALTQRVWDMDNKVGYVRYRDQGGTWSAWIPDFIKPRTQTELEVGGAAPYDGEERYFQTAAMKVLGIRWKFVYNATSASAYKWEFAGGSEWIEEIATEQTTASAVYTNLTTAGPRIDLPLEGDYHVAIGAMMMSSTVGSGALMSYSTNVAQNNASDTDRLYVEQQVGGQRNINGSRRHLKTGLAAMPLVAKYAASSNTAYFGNRWLSVVPKRVLM